MAKTSQFFSEGAISPRSQAFVIITAFFSLFAIVGFIIYGLPFFYDFYMKEFSWDRSVVTSGNMLGKIIVAPLFGFMAGWIIDRYGPRKMMMAGVLMTGLALTGLSLMKSQGLFYLCYIFVALGYVFGGPLPCQVLISRWFTTNRGKAMGIAYLGIGTGGALVPLIAAGLIKNFGWHAALATLGITVILIALPLTFFIKNSPVKSDVTIIPEPAFPVRSILKNPGFYLLAFGSICSIGAVGGVIQHLKLYLVGQNFEQSQAAHVISMVLFMSLAGRVIMGWLADLLPRKYVMILIYLIVASAIPLLIMPDFAGRIWLFAVIFGIGLGGDYMIIPLMAGDLFGVKTLGRVMGIILVADGIAESTMPYLVSRLYKLGGNYSIGFIVLIGIALTGVLIVSFLPIRRNELKAV
jgi:sugar phosphate permease